MHTKRAANDALADEVPSAPVQRPTTVDLLITLQCKPLVDFDYMKWSLKKHKVSDSSLQILVSIRLSLA